MLGAVALAELAATLRASRGLAAKRDIAAVAARLGLSADVRRPGRRRLRRDPGRRRLPAARHRRLHERVRGRRSVVRRLVRRDGQHLRHRRHGRPADRGGRCGLGGERRRTRQPVLAGMRAASEAFGVPIVGGHTNTRTDRGQLSVAILGRAQAPADNLRCAARRQPGRGDRPARPLPRAVLELGGRDRRARRRGCAATSTCCRRSPKPVLRCAAKDICQGGLIGTAMMLAECSRRRRRDRCRRRSEARGRAARALAADLSELRLSPGGFARERAGGAGALSRARHRGGRHRRRSRPDRRVVDRRRPSHRDDLGFCPGAADRLRTGKSREARTRMTQAAAHRHPCPFDQPARRRRACARARRRAASSRP